jgi:hypothetical protein
LEPAAGATAGSSRSTEHESSHRKAERMSAA